MQEVMLMIESSIFMGLLVGKVRLRAGAVL